MLWMKVFPSMLEELPMLFIMRLLIYNTRGVAKPSPTAPMVPKTMRSKSLPSACMKMDPNPIDPFSFFVFLSMLTIATTLF